MGGGGTLRRTLEGLRSPWQMSLACMCAMPVAMPLRMAITGRQRCGSSGGRKRQCATALRTLPALQYSCKAHSTSSARHTFHSGRPG